MEDDKGGFLGFSVVKNLPGNAGDAVLMPGLGRSHVRWTDSPWAATAEPASGDCCALSPYGRDSAARAATAARSPQVTASDQPEPAGTGDKPTRHQRPSTTKNNKENCGHVNTTNGGFLTVEIHGNFKMLKPIVELPGDSRMQCLTLL